MGNCVGSDFFGEKFYSKIFFAWKPGYSVIHHVENYMIKGSLLKEFCSSIMVI